MVKKDTSEQTGSGAVFSRESPVANSERFSGERAERVNRVLYAIANAVNVTTDLDELYQVIHHTLKTIIDVTNFFIAIVDSEKNTLYFPYFVDMVDDDFTPIIDFDTGHSLTGLVVVGQKPLLLNTRQLEERAGQEGIWGPQPLIWLGVPLIIRNRVIGVIAVQSYTDASLFSEDDLDLLTAVTDQIALAIDRKQSIDELRLSEQRFRQLFEQSNDAILIYNMQGDIVDCNYRASELIGYDRSRLLAMSFTDLVFQEDMEAVQQAFRETIREGHIQHETNCRTATGVRLEVEVSARIVEQKNERTLQVILRDVTMRKRAERQLLENEQKYRDLFYNAQVGLFRASPQGYKVLECNDVVATMAGYNDRQEFLDSFRLGEAYLTPLDRRRFLSEICRNGSITNFEVPLKKKNGDIGWFRFTASFSPQHEWLEGVVVDITNVKKATRETEKLQQELERSKKMEALGMLAGGVAHDLNNILAGIISYPELLLLKYADQPNLSKPLEAILESGNRAALIVADMLAIARSSASVMENHNIHELIEAYLCSPEFHKLESLYPGVKLKAQLAATQAVISCSSVHVKKCLMNLITNAFEAIGERGVVTLSTHAGRLPLEPGDLGSQTVFVDAVVLTIHDTGSGIKAEDLEHIFEPFYTRKMMGRSGTGLGLTVVWNTMQDHGGTVTVDSSGTGTSFMLVFPLATSGHDLNRPVRRALTVDGGGETILVVDDEPQLRAIACQVLSALGYVPHAVESGEAALQYLTDHQVDLVVLDMLMEPGMNGAETYEKILSLHPGQKAVIASGFSESEDVKNALALGVGGYIRKPYSMEQLSQTVRKILYPDNRGKEYGL